MKLNKFFILVAAICSFTSGFIYSVKPLINAITCLETFQRPGFTDVVLLHDYHNIEWPEQEEAMIKMLGQKKGHVSVEDMTEHIGSKYIQGNLNLQGISSSDPGSLNGLAGRLREAGISASTIDCRSGFHHSTSASSQEIVDDFRTTVNQLKVANPTDPVDILSNQIIEHSQKRTESVLTDLTKNTFIRRLFSSKASKHDIGFEAVDMAGLKNVCKPKDGNNYKYHALVAGAMHCHDVGLCLQNLGYKRVKSLGDEEKKGKIIFDTYKFLVPTANSSSYVLDSDFSDYDPLPISLEPLSPDQIEGYFKKRNIYTASKQMVFSSFSQLKSKVSSLFRKS